MSPAGQRRGRGREAPAPGQASLEDMAEEAKLDATAPRLHGDGLLVPDLPAGLAGPGGEVTPLGIVVEAAANYLAMRGWLDPDAGEWPDGLLAELAGIAQGNPCGDLCFTTTDGYLNPSIVADHFTQRRQEEWERSLPAWTCTCGRDFKMLADQGLGPSESFYEAAADGLLGDHADGIRRNARGRVTHSGACPGCGRRFADTLARQDDPQQPLLFG